MKSLKLIEFVIATLITMSSTAYCQKIARIEDLSSRVEKLWEVNIPVQPTRQGNLMYALLKTGVAVLSPDGQTIYCYDYNNGRLVWQAPGIQINSSNGALYSTEDGEYLLLRYPHNEVESTTAIYNSDGQLLWSALYETLFSIAPSGKYLISNYRFSGGHTPLTVLEIASGKMLWQAEYPQKPRYWQAAVGLNDKIVYYNAGSLKMLQLQDGNVLWEMPVEFDPKVNLGHVHTSLSGNVISYDATVGGLRNEKRVTYVFTDNGELLWQRTQAKERGKSNGGEVKGISKNGEYIAIKDGSRFSVFDIRTQRELWTLVEAGLSSIRLFTNKALIFSPRPEETKIITFKEDGNIQTRFTLSQFIDFKYLVQANSFPEQEHMDEVTPIVVEKTNGQFIISKFKLEFDVTK